MSVRRYLGITVEQAARERIATVFDRFKRVIVSFSAGKDSTVMLHLVADKARQRGRRFALMFVDLEGQYRLTIEHAERCFDLYADCAEPYWLALPLNLRNAVSQYEPQWMCWDPERRADWIREPPARAITDERRFPWFRRRMEFEELVPAFGDWYAAGEPCAQLVGIRTQESLNRWRTLASESKGTLDGMKWTTRKSALVYSAFPIYDWQTEDIWTYHARYPVKPHNELYDRMQLAGLSIHQQRICQPYGDDQRKGLWLFHVIEPETWARVVARVNGANQGALYATERGNILGRIKIDKAEGHTWETFAHLLLDSMPHQVAEHYRNKVAIFIRWWLERGYLRIPDESSPQLEAQRKAPSWRRVCKALLRNDYWAKGLGFSVPGNTFALERYMRCMRKKREEWNLMLASADSEISLRESERSRSLSG